MSRTFLFGGNQSSSQSQYLVQMKAGKMVRNGNTVRILIIVKINLLLFFLNRLVQ